MAERRRQAGLPTKGWGAEVDFNLLNEQQWESSKVEYFVRFGSSLKAAKANLVAVSKSAKRISGQPRLTWAAVEDAFGTLPFLIRSTRLGGAKLHILEDCLFSRLVTQFNQSKIWRAWIDFATSAVQASGGRPVALVVPRQGIPRGMVLFGPDNPFARQPGSFIASYTPSDAVEEEAGFACHLVSFPQFCQLLQWRVPFS